MPFSQRLAQSNTCKASYRYTADDVLNLLCLHRMEFQPGAGQALRMWIEAVKDQALKAVSCTYAFAKCKKSAFPRSTGLTPV